MLHDVRNGCFREAAPQRRPASGMSGQGRQRPLPGLIEAIARRASGRLSQQDVCVGSLTIGVFPVFPLPYPSPLSLEG